MNRLNGLEQTIALAALLLMVVPALAAPTSAVGDMDIGALMARADETLDLGSTDVVLLFDGRTVDIAADGAVQTTFHQIVWISTELGIDEYADLRVPWNTTNATLEVKALRTWMDGRWWPHESNLNPTAIVETVPYGVANADDYTTMRETMLLHDGVELPCIMETVYTVTRRFPEGTGTDGLWVFQRDDPAIRTSYEVLVAPDVPLSFAVGNGAPEPVVTRVDERAGYAWEMRDQPRLGVPHVRDATAHAPYACWSTWRDWSALGAALTTSIDAAAEPTDALRDTVVALTEHESHLPARIEAVSGFVAESVRHIGYDESHWAFEQRPAARVYETAYGNRLDRAVLATALLRAVEGVSSVVPVFRSAPASPIDLDVPGLARFGRMELFVSGEGVRGIYDPASSTFTSGLPDEYSERTIWNATSNAPGIYVSADQGSSLDGEVGSVFRCSVMLEQDDDGAWTGDGRVSGTGALSFHRSIVGVGNETERFCDGLASDVVGDAEVTASNVAVLESGRAVVGFTLAWDPGDQDEQERNVLTFGSPAAGLESRLPSDVHLYERERTSPVLLVAPIEETLSLRIRLPEDDVALAPAVVDIENGVGRFTQTVERDGDWLVVTRDLRISQVVIHPEWWPDLRELLLAGESAQSSTILYR